MKVNKMKNLLFVVLFLPTILLAQNETKEQDSTKTSVTTIEKIYSYIPETTEEKLYRLTHGHYKASYVRRVTSSDEYKKLVAENKRLEKERFAKHRLKVKNVSIAKAKKWDSIRAIQKQIFIKSQKRIDSIENARKLQRKK